MDQNENTHEPEMEVTKERPTPQFDINHFFADNRKMVLFTVGGLAAVILLWVGYTKMISEPAEIEAEAKIYFAEQYFLLDSVNLAVKGDGQHFGLERMVDEYSGTKAGKRAAFLLGKIRYNEKKYDEAIDLLEDYDLNDMINQPLALGLIGDCYVEKGELEKAASYFVKAAEISHNDFTTPRFYKKAGIVFENLNEFEKAKGYYEKIQKDFPNSEQARYDIEQRIARANAMIENGQ